MADSPAAIRRFSDEFYVLTRNASAVHSRLPPARPIALASDHSRTDILKRRRVLLKYHALPRSSMGRPSSQTLPEVGDVPNSEVAASFDHLVSADQESGRHCKPKSFRSLQIDDHQVFNWQLDGKLRCFVSSEDAIRIASSRVEYICEVGSVRNQAPISGAVW
jgi:hypothetical protein